MFKKIFYFIAIGLVAIVILVCIIAVLPALFLKWIDVAIFTVFIGLSGLCIFRRIRGSVLILACWCVLTAANVFLRLYPFSPEGYIGFISYALPVAETVCALLTGLWLIRLQKGKEKA